MKAIKINVETQRVEPIEIESDFRSIYTAIGNSCEIFECPVTLNNRDGLYVDEEAMDREMPEVGGFEFKGASFIGNGLIIGSGSQGESRDVKAPFRKLPNWLNFFQLQKLRNLGNLFKLNKHTKQ